MKETPHAVSVCFHIMCHPFICKQRKMCTIRSSSLHSLSASFSFARNIVERVYVRLYVLHGPMYTQRAAIILWIFIYVVVFFAQRQTIKMLTTKKKKMWKSKKCMNAHSYTNILDVCTWCGPLRRSILTMGLLLAILNRHTKTDQQIFIRRFVIVLTADELWTVWNETNIYSSLHNNAFVE